MTPGGRTTAPLDVGYSWPPPGPRSSTGPCCSPVRTGWPPSPRRRAQKAQQARKTQRARAASCGAGRARRQGGLRLPGQGSQWAGMARELADASPVFAAHMARCADALAPYVDWSLPDVLAEPGRPRWSGWTWSSPRCSP
ncbi:acyltransferase domain-containing protein [Streptomyces sp. M19]